MSLGLMLHPLQVWQPTSIPSPTKKATSPHRRSSRESTGMRYSILCFDSTLIVTSCYNAFSRLDMRVHVTIPGTVDSYCIDERGEKRPASDELWLETYLCSVLRAYSYADDGSGDTIRKIMGVRRFNPVTNTETEHRFLQAAEQLFFRGMLSCHNAVGYADLHRLAIRIRFYCPSPQQRVEPPHDRPPQILPHNWSVCFRNQSLRKVTDTKC